jgi:uncharacterized protein YciI
MHYRTTAFPNYQIAHMRLLIIALLLSTSAFSQEKKAGAPPNIRKYWFVMLTTGPNRTQDSATAAKLQAGHMANMEIMHQDGKLKVAGPFGDNGNWRGIFIFDCETKEEVVALLAKDPAIAAGRLAYEIHPWYTEPSGSFLPGKPKKNS